MKRGGFSHVCDDEISSLSTQAKKGQRNATMTCVVDVTDAMLAASHKTNKHDLF